MIDFKFCTDQVRRLAGKQGWPFIEEAQSELVRILANHARDVDHAKEVITDMCEHWERCPQPHELRAELRPRVETPEAAKTCRLQLCDGHGWVEVYFLHTTISIPGGAAYKEKKQITREQYSVLAAKVDWKDQQVLTGVARCECSATPKQKSLA